MRTKNTNTTKLSCKAEEITETRHTECTAFLRVMQHISFLNSSPTLITAFHTFMAFQNFSPPYQLNHRTVSVLLKTQHLHVFKARTIKINK